MGVMGGISVVLCVVVIVAYRNYKYEQELDSLLWRVDPKDLKVRYQLYSRINYSIAAHFLRAFS